MKYLIFTYLFLIIFIPGQSQFKDLIAKNKIDEFSELHIISTEERQLCGSGLFIKISLFIDLRKETKGEKVWTGYVYFTPPRTVAVDNNTMLMVIFKDGTRKNYTNEGKLAIIGVDDTGSIYFDIPKNDPFFSKPIKKVRLQGDGFTIDEECEDGVIVATLLMAIMSELKK